MDDQLNGMKQPYSLKNDTFEWIKAILIATVIVIVIRWFLFTPTVVSGVSMEPNFHDKERIIVNKIIYSIREPKRGEVIVFHAPEDLDFIKRIIALPGDTIKVLGDDVYINDELIEEPYIQDSINDAHDRGILYNSSKSFYSSDDGTSSVKVPENAIFVLGDNRPRSKDSRYDQVGFIPMDEIVGRADIIFWPISDIKLIKHPD